MSKTQGKYKSQILHLAIKALLDLDSILFPNCSGLTLSVAPAGGSVPYSTRSQALLSWIRLWFPLSEMQSPQPPFYSSKASLDQAPLKQHNQSQPRMTSPQRSTHRAVTVTQLPTQNESPSAQGLAHCTSPLMLWGVPGTWYQITVCSINTWNHYYYSTIESKNILIIIAYWLLVVNIWHKIKVTIFHIYHCTKTHYYISHW